MGSGSSGNPLCLQQGQRPAGLQSDPETQRKERTGRPFLRTRHLLGPRELSQSRPTFWQRCETTGRQWTKRQMQESGKRTWRESLSVSLAMLGSMTRLRIPSQLLVWKGEEDLLVTSTRSPLLLVRAQLSQNCLPWEIPSMLLQTTSTVHCSNYFS